MEINWLVLVAQIVNFLILVALLKRFLYGPIINMMDQREAKLRATVEDAEKKGVEAAQAADMYRRDRQELDEQRDAMLREAAAEAASERSELIRQARLEAQQVETRWRETIERSKASFLRDLRQRSGEEVMAIARKALADLAGADLEAQVIRAFTERLAQLDPLERDAMIAQIEDSGGEAMLVSAFPIPRDARGALIDVIGKQFGTDNSIDYEVSPDLLCGIEVRTAGRKIAWSLDSYLGELEDALARTLEEVTAVDAEEGRPDDRIQ